MESSFLLGLGFLGWLVQRVSPVLSPLQHFGLDTSTRWVSIPLRSSFARVSLSLYTVVVGEVDELEEDVG